MTHPTPDNPLLRAAAAAAAGALLASALFLSACDKKAPQAAAPPPQQAPAPQPEAAPADPREGLALAPKVVFAPDAKPETKEQAQAAAALAGALASGDAARLRDLLDEPARAVLDELQDSGAWAETTKGIEQVRICAVEPSEDALRLGLAVQDDSGAYLLAWDGREIDGRFLFTGLALAQDASHETAAEFDGVALTPRIVPTVRAEIAETGPDPSKDPRREQENTGRRRRGGSRPNRGG
jgi:hypothetical protein